MYVRAQHPACITTRCPRSCLEGIGGRGKALQNSPNGADTVLCYAQRKTNAFRRTLVSALLKYGHDCAQYTSLDELLHKIFTGT